MGGGLPQTQIAKLSACSCTVILIQSMMNIVLPDSQDPVDKKVTYAGMT